jgi:hypothetical protein
MMATFVFIMNRRLCQRSYAQAEMHYLPIFGIVVTPGYSSARFFLVLLRILRGSSF